MLFCLGPSSRPCLLSVSFLFLIWKYYQYYFQHFHVFCLWPSSRPCLYQYHSKSSFVSTTTYNLALSRVFSPWTIITSLSLVSVVSVPHLNVLLVIFPVLSCLLSLAIITSLSLSVSIQILLCKYYHLYSSTFTCFIAFNHHHVLVSSQCRFCSSFILTTTDIQNSHTFFPLIIVNKLFNQVRPP